MDKITVGKFIAERRKKLSLTQKQLAEMLNVTDKAVSRWETGKGYPDIETVERLAEVFGVTVNDILSGQIIAPEEKEKASRALIMSSFNEAERVRRNWVKTAVAMSVAFSLCILIIIPSLYFILLPDVGSGNMIAYSNRVYRIADEAKLPDNFVFYASEKGYGSKPIGRAGAVDAIRQSSNEVLYNSELLGRNVIYISFDESEIPTADEAVKFGASINIPGEAGLTLPEEPNQALEYLNLAAEGEAIDCRSLEGGLETFVIRLDFKRYDGYYIFGYVSVGDERAYFIPTDDTDICYEMQMN